MRRFASPLLFFAAGGALDILGASQSPAVLRRPNEADEDYRVRILQGRFANTNVTVAGIEANVLAFNAEIVDAQAVPRSPRRYQVDVYALKADLAALTPAEAGALTTHLNRADLAPAGTTFFVGAVVQAPYSVALTVTYESGISTPSTVEATVRAQLYARIEALAVIGEPVTRWALTEHFDVPGVSNVVATAPAADLPATPGTVHVAALTEANVVLTLQEQA